MPPMPLTDTACKNAKPTEKTRKLSDAAGLYLEITPTGNKYWRLKYRFLGKEKRLAFGVYPEVSLKEAREKRDVARKLLSDNIDPSRAKKEEKRLIQLNQQNSFESIALEWHESKKLGWTERHAEYVLRRIKANVFPALGQFPITEITAPELLSTLRLIEKRGALDIAHRVLQTCGQIFLYAIVTGRATYNPATDLRGALKTPKKEHYSSLKSTELSEFLHKLSLYEGSVQTKLAMQLLILTFVRTGELRGAKWEEINFEAAEWRIPAERMKMREQHIVPLTNQSMELLKKLKEISGYSCFIFPSQNASSKCMSENTMLYALYRMGYHNRTTVHGFRATASTILNESGFRSDVIERQLSHSERNKVRASYNHAQYLPERRKMMQWWADYLDAIVDGDSNVVVGKFGKVA